MNLPISQALTQEKPSSEQIIPAQLHENLMKKLEQTALSKRLEKIAKQSLSNLATKLRQCGKVRRGKYIAKPKRS
jgi:hypothetical protein